MFFFTFSGILNSFSKPFYNKLNLKPNEQLQKILTKMKFRGGREKGNPLHLQCSVSLHQSLKLLTEILPKRERTSNQKRESRCMRDKSFFLIFIVRVPNVDRQSKASYFQSFLKVPGISTLSCQCTPRQAQHADKCVLQSCHTELQAGSWLVFYTCLEVKMFVKIWNQT